MPLPATFFGRDADARSSQQTVKIDRCRQANPESAVLTFTFKTAKLWWIEPTMFAHAQKIVRSYINALLWLGTIEEGRADIKSSKVDGLGFL
jgi:hypothetical protein